MWVTLRSLSQSSAGFHSGKTQLTERKSRIVHAGCSGSTRALGTGLSAGETAHLLSRRGPYSLGPHKLEVLLSEKGVVNLGPVFYNLGCFRVPWRKPKKDNAFKDLVGKVKYCY